MSDHVYKTVEVTGSSPDVISDAIRAAVDKAAQSLRNLEWFEVDPDPRHDRGRQSRLLPGHGQAGLPPRVGRRPLRGPRGRRASRDRAARPRARSRAPPAARGPRSRSRRPAAARPTRSPTSAARAAGVPSRCAAGPPGRRTASPQGARVPSAPLRGSASAPTPRGRPRAPPAAPPGDGRRPSGARRRAGGPAWPRPGAARRGARRSRRAAPAGPRRRSSSTARSLWSPSTSLSSSASSTSPSICGPVIGAMMRPAYQRSFTRLRHSCQSSSASPRSACFIAARPRSWMISAPSAMLRPPLVAELPRRDAPADRLELARHVLQQPGVALELGRELRPPVGELALQRAHLVGGRRRDRVRQPLQRVEHDLRVAGPGQAAARVAHRRVLGPARRRGQIGAREPQGRAGLLQALARLVDRRVAVVAGAEAGDRVVELLGDDPPDAVRDPLAVLQAVAHAGRPSTASARFL